MSTRPVTTRRLSARTLGDAFLPGIALPVSAGLGIAVLIHWWLP